jgi:tetratricopeptide (TPR) repeat protein
MKVPITISGDQTTSVLARQGYWPAWAARSYEEGKYADVVKICRDRLADDPHLLSGRILYAKALLHVNQMESALEQLYMILAIDPDNLVALKLLGDCACLNGDDLSAHSSYERVLEVDPDCQGLVCELNSLPVERTHTITLTRPEEPSVINEHIPLRSIPFYTETMGDLYLAQGYPRLAATVYKVLHDRSRHPRLLEKLSRAEEKVKAKE